MTDLSTTSPSRVRPAPWTAVFERDGGYDCMTSAWIIRDALGRRVATVDLADYGHPPCRGDPPEDGAAEAMRVALLIAHAGSNP